MKALKKVLSIFAFVFSILTMFNINYTTADNIADSYTTVLGDTIQDASLQIIMPDAVTDKTWAALFNQQVINLIGYMIDIFLVIWIAIAFFGAYKMMFSSKEDDYKEWLKFVVYGAIWVIIMVSAKFISWVLVDNLYTNLEEKQNWIQFASDLYNNLLYPFIKVALYLVVWFLFFVMAAKVISFVISTDEAAKKKAWWIIIWCVIWIFIIMWSKQLVEAVMWSQDAVLNKSAQVVSWWDGWMGGEMLEFGSIPLIAQIINWVMWLTMFVVLILIIIQGYKMFTKPDDPKNRESMKKTLLYVIIWVLVIWASYVISNVLVVNNIPAANL